MELTHVKSLLRAHLLDQEHLRNAQLNTDMGDRLAVHEVLLQTNVPDI
jgi:L-rhamnose isomerase